MKVMRAEMPGKTKMTTLGQKCGTLLTKAHRTRDIGTQSIRRWQSSRMQPRDRAKPMGTTSTILTLPSLSDRSQQTRITASVPALSRAVGALAKSHRQSFAEEASHLRRNSHSRLHHRYRELQRCEIRQGRVSTDKRSGFPRIVAQFVTR